MATRGRPTSYNHLIAAKIIREIPFRQLKELLGEDGLPAEDQEKYPTVRTFYNWLTGRPKLQWAYECAMRLRADYLADECLEIADDTKEDYQEKFDERSGELIAIPKPEMVARSRLRIDTRLKLMAVYHPKKYGNGLSRRNPFDEMTEEELDEFLRSAEATLDAGGTPTDEGVEGQANSRSPAPSKKAKG